MVTRYLSAEIGYPAASSGLTATRCLKRISATLLPKQAHGYPAALSVAHGYALPQASPNCILCLSLPATSSPAPR